MNRMTKILFGTYFFIGLLCFSGNADGWAQSGEEPDMKPVAEAMVSSSGIGWMPKINYTKLILNI
jgi:hypothetical protein